jgi:flavin-dependent dehydrogenase
MEAVMTGQPVSAVRKQWGAVVVGAGPAGSLAARQLAIAGIDTLLVEKARFPREKVCGCCLSARALAVLESVGLGDLAARHSAAALETLRLSCGPAHAAVAIQGGASLSRAALDCALVEAATHAGARFLSETTATVMS